MKYYIVLIIMTILGACGSFYLKKASDAKKLKILVITPAFYLGGFLYLLSAILNIYILKFLDYSVVLPLTSITYIWTFVLSYCFLKEGITHKKIIGIVLIVLGSIIIAV